MSATVIFQHKCDQCGKEPKSCICPDCMEKVAQTITKQQQRISELEERLMHFLTKTKIPKGK